MVKGKTRKLLLALVAMLAMALFVPLTAQAAELTDGTFDTPFGDADRTFSTDDPATQEVWLQGSNWERTTDPDPNLGNIAEKTVPDGTGILLQGFELPDTCIGNGWKVKVRFDYKNPNGDVSGNVKVLGFTSGTWSSETGAVAGDPITLVDAPLDNTIVNEDTGETDWGTFQTCVTLTGDTSGFTFLAIGFDLPDPVTVTPESQESVTYNSAVDKVEVLLVAPVTMKLTPRTLNLKSKGNWVTVAISIPSDSCYTLSDIDTSTLELSAGSDCFGPVGFAPDKFKVLKKKVHAKFSRSALIGMLGENTGPAVPVMVSGTFNDGVAFEGVTTLRVINPGGGSSNKPAKPAKTFKFLPWR